MKNLLIALLLLLSSVTFSQTSQGSYTLLRDPDSSRVNAYASLDGAVMLVHGIPTWSAGGTIGMTMNRSFSTGFTGAFVIPSDGTPIPDHIVALKQFDNTILRQYLWYAGVLLEPTFFPKLPLHLTFPIVLGGGGLSYREQETNDWLYTPASNLLDRDYFFLASVGARVEINIVDGFRISCGPSYRYASASCVDFLNGFSIDLSLKLGQY